MRAVLVKTKKLNADIISLWFKPESDYHYLAGQYAEVTFGDEKRQSIGDNRWFTLSSSPDEDLLTITTKLNLPLSDFKARLVSLNVNDEIILSEAIGDFVLPKDPSINLIFIAGGIGITPVRSILKYLSDRHEKRPIQLLYVVASTDDLIFNEVINEYGLEPIVAIKQENAKQLMSMIKEPVGNAIFYLSGPQRLVEDLDDFIKKTHTKPTIVMDYFPGYLSV